MHTATSPRLSVVVSPRQARPGETVQVQARYTGRASVRVALSYGGRVLTTITGRADRHGVATLHLRAPARLRRGDGAASLRVSAVAGGAHHAVTVSLPLHNLTLMGTVERRAGRLIEELRVAYLAGARVTLTLAGPHSWHRALPLDSDRHGVATVRVSLPGSWRGVVHLTVQAKGQRGRDHAAQVIALTLVPPKVCR